MFWLVFESSRDRHVALMPAPSLIHARLGASLQGLGELETFVEGHQLEPKMIKKIPKGMIGKRLSARQASQLLKHLG